MKKIGILGGMSPESSLEYYSSFISLSQERLPEGRYPELVIYNLNFEDFCRPVSRGKDERVRNLLREKLTDLEKAGVDFALMASNTPHMYYDELKKEISIPLLSIVEATAEKAKKEGYERVGLLGTDFTMTGDFYEKDFADRDMEIVVPDEGDREVVHDKIMNELVNGKMLDSTRRELVKIIKKMQEAEGIEAIILGCTELPLILSEEEAGIPVLDTTKIHVEAGFDLASD
ncbi:amino acid racemase [Candidatus Bipolaricaulota bacterium]|nr:amino acid racemase [Candidatus Bipolaricaulota bacterium]